MSYGKTRINFFIVYYLCQISYTTVFCFLWKVPVLSDLVFSVSKMNNIYLLAFSFFSYFMLIPSFSQLTENHAGTPSTRTAICCAFIIVSFILCCLPCPVTSY